MKWKRLRGRRRGKSRGGRRSEKERWSDRE